MVWTQKLQGTFQTLKDQLTGDVMLVAPTEGKAMILQTDMSEIGVGAVLSQEDGDRNERPIAYFSRKLLPCEQRYG